MADLIKYKGERMKKQIDKLKKLRGVGGCPGKTIGGSRY